MKKVRVTLVVTVVDDIPVHFDTVDIREIVEDRGEEDDD